MQLTAIQQRCDVLHAVIQVVVSISKPARVAQSQMPDTGDTTSAVASHPRRRLSSLVYSPTAGGSVRDEPESVLLRQYEDSSSASDDLISLEWLEQASSAVLHTIPAYVVTFVDVRMSVVVTL